MKNGDVIKINDKDFEGKLFCLMDVRDDGGYFVRQVNTEDVVQFLIPSASSKIPLLEVVYENGQQVSENDTLNRLLNSGHN
jgi:hypothetical protein